MKVSLTKQQLEGLHLLVTISLAELKPITIPDKLVWSLMDKLNERMRDKIRKMRSERRIDLKMTWSLEESAAFWFFLKAVREEMQQDYKYEIIVADRIYHEIEYEYA